MPVSYTLTINRRAAKAAAMDAAVKVVTATTLRVFNRANVLTPVRTGNLRAHNNLRVFKGANAVTGEVFNDAAYAAAVHNGTKAYTVRPKRKKALRWKTRSGEIVFAKSARIPARRGRPWLYRALTEVAGPAGFIVSKR